MPEESWSPDFHNKLWDHVIGIFEDAVSFVNATPDEMIIDISSNPVRFVEDTGTILEIMNSEGYYGSVLPENYGPILPVPEEFDDPTSKLVADFLEVYPEYADQVLYTRQANWRLRCSFMKVDD